LNHQLQNWQQNKEGHLRRQQQIAHFHHRHQP
jgi:hypothetical protein